MDKAQNRLAALAGWILLCELAGGLGSLFTVPAIPGWYAGLVKPALNPPSWIFGPVWVTLYVLMAAAAWLVRRVPDRPGRPITLFLVQLALNAVWSPLFFGLRNPGFAFVELCALWVAIVATTVAFWRIKRAAGALMIPYLAWVTFAGYLNAAIWLLNRH